MVGRNFEYGKAFYKRRQPLKRNEELANDTRLLDQAADAYAEGYLGKYKTRGRSPLSLSPPDGH